jgi:predicted regulator of Ras-like GTPase activity (Roadblock/LC7/MglB family)
MISQAISSDLSLDDLSMAISSIGKEIDHLNKFRDVHAVILFRLDGQVLESRYSQESSRSLLIVSNWVKNIISKTMVELQRGSRSVKYDKEISNVENIPVYFYRAGNSSILVTFLDSRANTGFMEIEMSRTARRLGWIIDKKRYR